MTTIHVGRVDAPALQIFADMPGLGIARGLTLLGNDPDKYPVLLNTSAQGLETDLRSNKDAAYSDGLATMGRRLVSAKHEETILESAVDSGPVREIMHFHEEYIIARDTYAFNLPR